MSNSASVSPILTRRPVTATTTTTSSGSSAGGLNETTAMGSLSPGGVVRDVVNKTRGTSTKVTKQAIQEAENVELVERLVKLALERKLIEKILPELQELQVQVKNPEVPAYDNEKFKADLRLKVDAAFEKYKQPLYLALGKLMGEKGGDKDQLERLVEKTLLTQVHQIIQTQDIPLVPNEAEKEFWNYLREVTSAIANPVGALQSQPTTWKGRSVKVIAGAAIGWGLGVRYGDMMRQALPSQVLSLDEVLGGYAIPVGAACSAGLVVFLYEWVVSCLRPEVSGGVPAGLKVA